MHDAGIPGCRLLQNHLPVETHFTTALGVWMLQYAHPVRQLLRRRLLLAAHRLLVGEVGGAADLGRRVARRHVGSPAAAAADIDRADAGVVVGGERARRPVGLRPR